MSKELDPKDVELFLLDNLDFFESRESLVGELKFKHSSASAASIPLFKMSSPSRPLVPPLRAIRSLECSAMICLSTLGYL